MMQPFKRALIHPVGRIENHFSTLGSRDGTSHCVSREFPETSSWIWPSDILHEFSANWPDGMTGERLVKLRLSETKRRGFISAP